MKLLNTFVLFLCVIGLGFSSPACRKSGESASSPEAKPMADPESAKLDLADEMDDSKNKMMASAPMEKSEKKSIGGKGGGNTKPKTGKTWKRSTQQANTSKLMIGDKEELPLTGMQVQARVDGFRARVLIDFYFFNDRNQQYEGTFKLRLPEGGSPYFLAFGQSRWEADGAPAKKPQIEPIEVVRRRGLEPQQIVADRQESWSAPKVARMVPKEKAARAYTDTVRRRVDPALMEWSGAGVFSARIFPIAPGRLHRVVVGYDMDLTRLGDTLEMLLPLPKDLSNCTVDLDVAVLDGAKVKIEPGVAGKTEAGRVRYRVLNPKQPIVLRQENAKPMALVGSDPAAGDVFATRVQPELPIETKASGAAQAIFLVDVSMSSNPERFPIWLTLMAQILEANRSNCKQFAVLFFNVEHFWFAPGFRPNTPEQVAALMKFTDGLALEGASDLGTALKEAAWPGWGGDGDPGPVDFFLLSDGAVTWGQGDAFALSKLLGNGKLGALFAYRTGMTGSDKRMLDHLARETGGAVFSVVGEDEVAAAVRAHTRRPWEIHKVLLDGASDVLLAGRPRYIFPGQRLRVAGRGKIAKGAKLSLELRQGNRTKTLKLALAGPIPSELAARVYGQLAVNQLEDFLEAVAEPAGAYARHYRVTGKTTSLLMLESEEDYQRYDIKPLDDQKVVRERLAVHLIASALDTLFTVLGDAKYALEAGLKKLKDIPGVKLALDPAFQKALEGLPKEIFDVQVPALVCKDHRGEGSPEPVRSQLKKRKPEYDTLSAEALRRKQANGAGDGLKLLSSLVEANPGDGVLARDVGFSAMEWGLAAHAYHLFRRVAERRPWEPQTYRALALSLAAQGNNNLALVWFEVGLSGEWDSRFGEFKRILMLDYLHFLGKHPPADFHPLLGDWIQKRKGLLLSQLGMQRADVLISITWNTDNTDVDLHVFEPSGEECLYSHPETKSGGKLTEDVTQGYGPEMYLLPKAPRGVYKVRAKYFASDSNRASARTKVHATIYQYWGTPKERVIEKVITLEYGKEMHDLAVVKMP